MFYLLKVLFAFLSPPGIFVLLFLVVGGWLYRKEKKIARLILALSLIFYILTTPFLGNMLVGSLEKRYHPLKDVKGDVLIMLGAGATSDTPDVDGIGQLSNSGTSRLFTVLKLYTKTRLPIILSGGQVFSDSGNEAIIAKRYLVSLGVPENKIIVEDKSINTEENASNTKVILREYRFSNPILVTSAFHMERSVLNFLKIGISVQPYPTDYRSNFQYDIYINQFVPSYEGFLNTSIAIKEYIGIFFIKLSLLNK